MKVLVTGGSGFIGSHVCDELEARGIKPIVFDRFPRSEMVKTDVINADIKDREAVNYAVAMTDGAINLAGILGTSETVDNPFPSAEVNILGGLNFLQALRENKKTGVQIAVGNHWMNNSYSITKTTTERFSLMFNKEHGVDVGVVRALNAYGERQKHAPIRKIVPNFVVRALRNEPIEIYGDGEQIMDMVYVRDVAMVLVDALLKKWDKTKILEVGTGRRTTVNQLAEMVNTAAGSTAGIKHIPMRQGEIDHAVVVGDPGTLLQLYPHGPKLMSFEKGIEKTIKWYKENYDYSKI